MWSRIKSLFRQLQASLQRLLTKIKHYFRPRPSYFRELDDLDSLQQGLLARSPTPSPKPQPERDAYAYVASSLEFPLPPSKQPTLAPSVDEVTAALAKSLQQLTITSPQANAAAITSPNSTSSTGEEFFTPEASVSQHSISP